MTLHLDLAAYDQENRLVLTVEVKTKLNASKEWAIKLRRNLHAHGSVAKVPFFLLALPDKFYLWTNDDGLPLLREPNYIIDARPLLAPDFEQSDLKPETVSATSFELLVASWLNDLIYRRAERGELSEAERWVIESGLYAALKDGYLRHQVAA